MAARILPRNSGHQAKPLVYSVIKESLKRAIKTRRLVICARHSWREFHLITDGPWPVGFLRHPQGAVVSKIAGFRVPPQDPGLLLWYE